MRLLLLRHAIAAERDPERYPDDGTRPLTREGERRMRRAALGMRRLGVKLDLILASPLVRTVATARIVAAVCRPRATMRLLKPLAPGGGVGGILGALGGLPPQSEILLVGHEPDLSLLTAALVLERRSEMPIEFKKGALARIDTEGAPRPGNGRLVYLLPPRVLRRIAARRSL
jgi:phosphohistidine phosphatase